MAKYPKEPTETNNFRVECTYCGHTCYAPLYDVAIEVFARAEGSWYCDALCIKLSYRANKRRTPYPLK